MASISSWLWGSSQLDEAVDKATSELIPTGSEDVALNLEICDQIRSKSVPAKDAMRALKRRLNHKNPNVQLLALGLADVCVKNGGDLFLNEVASREFIDNLVSILKVPGLNPQVKNEILKIIQNWALAFEGRASLGYVGQVYKSLKTEGYDFPPKDLALANSAMVDTSTAPEWIDSEVCLRCRTAFSFTNRKHHCRNCGQVFDQQCSSKVMPLPHFGITQSVRVCDGCHSKLTKKVEKTHNADRPHRHSASMYSSRHRSARDLADAELQRAIQLSLEEVGAAHGNRRPGYVPAQPAPSSWQVSEPPLVDRNTRPGHDSSEVDEDDPDLRAAIEASLREANAPKPSAPIIVQPPPEPAQPSYGNVGYSQSYPPTVTPTPSAPKLPNYDLEPLESDAILTFSQTVEQVHAQGGRDISRYPAVNELYDKANSLRPKLAMSMDDTGRKEQLLSEMHDKLSQAVKLYDNLLSEQVSRPTWTRSPQATSPGALQPVNGYQTTPNASFSQWVHTQAPPPMSPAYVRPDADATRGYASQNQIQPVYSPVPPNRSDYQPQYSQPSRNHASTFAASSSQQNWSHQPQHSGSSQYNQQVPQKPTSPIPNQPSQTPQYTGSQSSVPYHVLSAPAPPQLPAQSPQPVSATVGLAPQPSAPVRQTPVPVSAEPTPYPMHALSRHNTVAHSVTTVSSPPPSANAFLARSSTVSHAPRYQPRREQPPPAPLPQFPVAPTNAPQSFDIYALSPPSGIASPERREELLIDL
ncbi:hypothetical protein SERLA73DRAFT_117010 [Serpula lacrymans var. lacrymans S7.3]|uniref:Vacuolar protein sorting-associated protein 27 n=1 Tax=Serpula lacrymans var. lacrymans (strain S7.3) TaxID=936435 RepID=F8QG94_SERL3|nr:hypothetical protein SERLA73DRAFT_117010 [Serpula lacrymans var. lacrymans S7.3]